jgi:hypothetical protein
MQQGDDFEAQEVLRHVQYAKIFQPLAVNLKIQLGLLGNGKRTRTLKRHFKLTIATYSCLHSAPGPAADCEHC